MGKRKAAFLRHRTCRIGREMLCSCRLGVAWGLAAPGRPALPPWEPPYFFCGGLPRLPSLGHDLLPLVPRGRQEKRGGEPNARPGGGRVPQAEGKGDQLGAAIRVERGGP